MPRRRSSLLAKLGLLALGVVLSLLALEATLRIRPTLLGYGFASGALSKYTTRDGGIYYRDRNLGMNFMIPNFRTTMYANGYTWHHETDALGFRNAPLHIPADVIVLGDSLVYGQGVEFADTVAHRLEEASGLRVANLGRQGDCSFQEAYLLTAYIDVFKPRTVVYVFTPNDIADLYAYLSPRAMEDFIAQPVARIRYPERVPIDVALRDRAERIRRQSVWKRIEEKSYVFKMGRWIQHTYRTSSLRVGPAVAQAAPRTYPTDITGVANDASSLGWRYTEHAIAYMDHVSRQHGAALLVVPITSGPQFGILRDITERHHIDFLDTSAVMTTSLFLPNDGHFSPAGARTIANAVADVLRRPRSAPMLRAPGIQP